MSRFTTTSGRFKSSSQRLVDHFGVDVLFTHIGVREYDIETQTTIDTSIEVTVKAFLTQPKHRESKSPNLVGKTGSVVLIAKETISFIPKVNDLVSTKEGLLTVVEAIPYNAGDDESMWRLLCTSS